MHLHVNSDLCNPFQGFLGIGYPEVVYHSLGKLWVCVSCPRTLPLPSYLAYGFLQNCWKQNAGLTSTKYFVPSNPSMGARGICSLLKATQTVSSTKQSRCLIVVTTKCSTTSWDKNILQVTITASAARERSRQFQCYY